MTTMPRYMVVRKFSVDESQMPAVGRRSREIVDDMAIIWEHSHVAIDEDGNVRTYCVYEADNLEQIEEHQQRLGLHDIEHVQEIVGDVTPADFP
jgi:hypothetical protein